MDQRLTIITLGVSDLPTLSKFYQGLGWNKTKSSNDNICFFKLNGILLSLYPRDKLAQDAMMLPSAAPTEKGTFKGMTLAYNCKSRKEVDQVFAFLKSKNVKIVKKPQEVFWGGYSGYFVDPEDNAWEVAHNPFLQLDANGNVVDEE